MNGTRYQFRQAAITFFGVFVALVLLLNHGMLTEDTALARLAFYGLAIVVPLGLVGTYRHLRDTHRGRLQDEAKEGLILFGFGAAIIAALWLVSTLFYEEPERYQLSDENRALVDKYLNDDQ